MRKVKSNKYNSFITIICVVFFAATLAYCTTPITKIFEAKNYSNNKGEQIPYRFLKPKQIKHGEKYPLVLFLHGAGERGNDNKIQLVNGVQLFARPEMMNKYPCFIIVPQCPKDLKWVNTDWKLDKHIMQDTLSFPLRLVTELLRETIKKFPIDTTRIYLTGVSMGGFGVWDLLERFPNEFAAAAPVCGGADETKATLIKDVPVWAFHGGKDHVVKTIRSRNIIEALKNAGGNPMYTEYPDLGHNAWDSAYKDSKIPDWMFKQHLK